MKDSRAELADRLALRPREAAQMLGISERLLRTVLPELPHVRVGGAVLLPVDGLREWLTEEAKANLGVVSEHVGDKGQSGRGEWYWSLPDEGKEARDPQSHLLAPDTLALPASRHEADSESEGESPEGGGWDE